MSLTTTWNTAYIHPYMVNIVYKFESSRKNSVFHENATGNSAAITVTGGAHPVLTR